MKNILILPFILGAYSVNGAMLPSKQILTTNIAGLSLSEIFLIFAILIMSVALLVVMLTLQKLAKVLLKPQIEEESAYTQAMQNRTFWQKLGSLKPLSMEKDLMIKHEFDGIAELDNPTPPWFMYLFYGTIAISVVYLVNFHVIGNGQIMTHEYAEEIAVADKAHEAYMKKFANSVNENNVKLLTDAKSVEDGNKIYTQSCVACHGDKGQGGVGPNLTDEYWLHGGSTKEIFHTITEGVAEKGMIAWKKTLNPIQVQHVVSYIATMQGTKPANAKEAQGEKVAVK